MAESVKNYYVRVAPLHKTFLHSIKSLINRLISSTIKCAGSHEKAQPNISSVLLFQTGSIFVST